MEFVISKYNIPFLTTDKLLVGLLPVSMGSLVRRYNKCLLLAWNDNIRSVCLAQ